MPDDHNQTDQRPDHWLTETTTPGLLMQTDLNSGESEPLFAGAAAPHTTTDDQGDERPGLLLKMAALKRRNCANFDQLIRPVTEARTTRSAAEAHAYFFGAGQGDEQEQAKRLRLLSRELELTAAHIRRVLE